MKAILALLSVTTEAEAIDVLTGYNTFLSDARAATGTQDMPTALRAIQGNASLLRQIETATGKQGPAAVEAAIAWKEPAAQSGQLATQVAALEADKSTRERDAYIAYLSTDHPAEADKPAQPAKLPPSLHGWAKTQTLAQLQAWAKDAPPASLGKPAGSKPEITEGGAGGALSATLSAEEAEACKHLGIDHKTFLERKAFEAKALNPAAAQAVNPGA